MRLIKKILFIGVLCFCLVNSYNVVKASDGESLAIEDELNEADFEETNNEIIELGKNARKRREVFTISITRFLQTDSAWANDLMLPKNKTIGEAGCYLTSFAMVANYFKPSAGYNPKTINVLLGDAACGFNRVTAGNKVGLTILNYCSGETARNNLDNIVSGSMVMDRPVIIGLVKANGDTHYVVARGYSVTSGEIYIADPGSSSINTLSAYTNAGGYVNMLLVYID